MKGLLKVLFVGLLFFGALSPVSAAEQSGFTLRDSSLKGIKIYSQPYKGGEDILIFANLAEGARVEFLTGKIAGVEEKPGMFGGPNYDITRLSIKSHKAEASKDPQWVCVGNGGVFNARGSGAKTAGAKATHYPLKNAAVTTEGWGESLKGRAVEFGLVQIWPGAASILNVNPNDPAQFEAARKVFYGLEQSAEQQSVQPQVSQTEDPFLKALYGANGLKSPTQASPVSQDPFVQALLKANGFGFAPAATRGPAPQILGAPFRRAQNEVVTRSALYILDTNGDSTYETVVYARTYLSLMDNSKGRIEGFLQQFGRFQFVALDGGYLSQLVCRTGGINFDSNCENNRDRFGNPAPDYSCWFPQAVGIFAAP